MGIEPQFCVAGLGTGATVPPPCAGEGAPVVTKPSWAGWCCPPGLSCPGALVQVGSAPDGVLGAELPSRELSSSGAKSNDFERGI